MQALRRRHGKGEQSDCIHLPLAGTRPRGKDEKEDQELEADLLSDEKELAEHNMLVDLGRNDLGRFCRFER
ncbi:MAG: chorismate-binding protein [Gallintestinimicrobium sp.]